MTGELGLALAAIAGALLALWSWRSSEARALRLDREREALAKKFAEQGADLANEKRARKRQAEELAALRTRADKARKRKAKTSDQPLGTVARIRDHEARVERAELERDRAISERDALGREVAGLESRLAASKQALEEASAPAPAPSVEPETGNALAGLQAELSVREERIGKLEEELATARQAEARMRKRMNNQEQLYASLRAELEVKKDRLRTQEEQLQRLQALKVAVLD